MNSITWRSPSNIALVKYWGKRDMQIPMNPSISFSLSTSFTETKVGYEKKENFGISFLFDGKPNKEFETRLLKFITSIFEYIPIVKSLYLTIESKNSFPHSSGIASSASAMSALALCLVSIEKEINGNLFFIDDFHKKASFLARLGSGSAARSIYGGINLWGEYGEIPEASNNYSIDITAHCHPIFKNYCDAILIVTDKTKKVSSSIGHGLMDKHPFATQKFEESFKNTSRLLEVMKVGNLDEFVAIVEEEALSLHAMMMTSHPSYLLMEPNTLTIINKIREYRETSHIPVCFTLDAGANVHLLYPKNNAPDVKTFINNELTALCINNRWIDDAVGFGPQKI